MSTNWKTLTTAGAVAALLLFIPFFREEADAPFVIEPSERVVLRTGAPALVDHINVKEGDTVTAGEQIAGLRSFAVDSAMARAASGFRTASARATVAELRNAGYESVVPEQRHWSRELAIAGERSKELNVLSPVSGTVVTPRIEDLRGTWIDEGTTIAEIQNLSTVRARVFIAEPDMRVLTRVTGNSLRLYSAIEPLRGKLESISPTVQPIEAGLIPDNQYKGLTPPPQYVALILLDNPDGSLRSGMSGEAKIFGIHRSIGGMAWQAVADFVARKVW